MVNVDGWNLFVLNLPNALILLLPLLLYVNSILIYVFLMDLDVFQKQIVLITKMKNRAILEVLMVSAFGIKTLVD